MTDAIQLIEGDCREVLPALAEGAADAVVTDPPYGLSFMGQDWDHGVPGTPYWSAVRRVLRPGGYALVFGGSRTYHRLACAVEDAGFEPRDCILWLYGQGFPKSKGCLKPAYEPILLCRRPGPRVLPLGVDECRVPAPEGLTPGGCRWKGTSDITYAQDGWTKDNAGFLARSEPHPAGRWPANVCHDGSDEVFGAFGEKTSGKQAAGGHVRGGDTGSAARFYYCAKASKADRGDGNTHPTVKPTALVEWLVRLVCPPGGVVLDPFLGSGTTGVACVRTGRRCIGVELNPEYAAIARRRFSLLFPTEGAR